MVKKLLALACASVMLISSVAYAAENPSPGHVEVVEVKIDDFENSDLGEVVVNTTDLTPQEFTEKIAELAENSDVNVVYGDASDITEDSKFVEGFEKSIAFVDGDGNVEFPAEKPDKEVSLEFVGLANINKEDLNNYTLIIVNPTTSEVAYINLGEYEGLKFDEATGTITFIPPIYGDVALVQNKFPTEE